MTLEIKCDDVRVDTSHYTNKIQLNITNVDLSFLNDLDYKDVLNGVDNKLLFEKLVENDDELLHDYFVRHGYVFSKN